MYDSKIRYLASIFIDAESISPNAQLIADLIKVLDDDRFTPITIQENTSAGLKPRVGFITENAERQLFLLSNRFDYSHIPTGENGTNLGDFSEFCKDAISKFTTLINYFGREAHRLAAVQEGLLPEMTKREMEKIANRIFNFPPTYEKHKPFEWNWRAVASVNRRIGGKSEATNTIAKISRIRGSIITTGDKIDDDIKDVDRIRLDIDINTSVNNVVAKFGVHQVSSFFEQVNGWHEEFGKEILTFVSN